MTPSARIPDFFIVGAPKSGTTALYDYLGQHPDIFVSAFKEPHFFAADLHLMHPAPLSLSEYLALFAGAKGEHRLGEASTTYLFSEVAANRIKAFNRAASIIVMLRHPVDMMYARHSQNLWTGAEDIPDFAAALDVESERRRGRHLPPGARVMEALFYRGSARYTEQVARYLDAFGRDRVHVIIYDDFRRDPGRAYASTLRFLGVAEDFRPAFAVINANKRPRNRTVDTVLLNPPAAIRWLARTMLSQSRRKRFKAALRLMNARIELRPPMDPALRRQLQAEFTPEIARLGELLGRDLSAWNDPRS